MMVLVLFPSGHLQAQSTTWDDILSDSQWYVPAANLSAYMASGTNLADSQLIADQTVWAIGSCVNGVFTGTSTATFKVGPVENTAVSTMNGLVVTETGQLRIVFGNGDNPPTIGIGQMREVNNATYVEMQMISGSSGSGGVFITHWAYMASYDGNLASLPPLVPSGGLLSPEWNWMAGTSWNLECADLFGAGEVGSFSISNYTNGYFWGTGSGPEGSAAASFSLIGSATPEGNVLFNILSGDTLTSLTGQIVVLPSTGTMGLRAYEAGEVGSVAMAQVVPEPSNYGLIGLGVSLVLWRLRRRSVGELL